MAQKGIIPWVAIPAASVTACCSAMPTSKVRLGNFSNINFKELPVSMAGVIPIIFSFCAANSTMVFPKTSWYFGGVTSVLLGTNSPVLASNFPGAWYFTWSFSARSNPFPLMVLICKNLGPFLFFKRLNSLSNPSKSWPSIGPE